MDGQPDWLRLQNCYERVLGFTTWLICMRGPRMDDNEPAASNITQMVLTSTTLMDKRVSDGGPPVC